MLTRRRRRRVTMVAILIVDTGTLDRGALPRGPRASQAALARAACSGCPLHPDGPPEAPQPYKRATGVKVEGRKSHAELRPEVVSEAKRLCRRSPKTGERRSLREISAELAAMGHLGSTGRPFSPSIIKAMVEA